jgi:hypothetical protein
VSGSCLFGWPPQGYIYRLENFDGPAVAEKALEHGLAEEAFEIYKKFNKRVEAVKVMRADNMTGYSADSPLLQLAAMMPP